ncbi:MAG TPA: tannase/feruloyl esterase family alpha/beta hydrolase [Terriglobia bacterium]|nr:tannase/feruloyl esterase family alpha/beta hydrolase [Terriglobia bacterium]
MSKPLSLVFLAVLFTSSAFGQPADSPQTACEQLKDMALPSAKVTSARAVEAGAFTPPAANAGPGQGPSYKDVPAFCRVTIDAKPTADSDIKIDVWMPASGWNGRFRGQGNGGFAGTIDYPGLAAALKLGYAAAGTDTGHAGSAVDAAWALGHPEKVIDFGYRGIHEMTRQAKLVMTAFYGRHTQRAYFASCSDGGREALMEAQRFPEDYDGILAGAPANYWTHLLTAAMWDVQALTQEPGSYIPASKVPAISAAVLAACDAQDGLADGILNDPRQCHFDPATLACQGAESDRCLTAPEVTALKKIYAGPTGSAGHQIFPGLAPGGEEGPGGWGLWVFGPAPGRSLITLFGEGYFSGMVYEKADWDPKAFSVDDAVKLADAKTAGALNSTDPNLQPFEARGGKLILYHGWSDAAIAPVNTIDYYHSVVAKMGRPAVDSFMRLYMVPGMQHCGGGPGPNSFGQFGGMTPTDPEHNAYMALEQWVEKGSAPSKIIATKYVDDSAAKGVKITRPLCPYPEVAKYRGSGDANSAANFVCSPAVSRGGR